MVFLLFHLDGVGVREHNPFAAAMVFIYFTIDTLATGVGIVRIVIAAVLLSNLRATGIAGHWKSDSDEAALPPRLGETWSDSFADKWPAFIWPKIKVLYYIFSFSCLVLTVSGFVLIALRRHAP